MEDDYSTDRHCGKLTARGYNQTTAHGRAVWPADPRPEEVHVDDIALQLSRLCRFNGALVRRVRVGLSWVPVEIYSVAQHSCLVYDNLVRHHPYAPRWLRLGALFHDAAEYLYGDMPKPVKFLHPERKAIEAKATRAIEAMLGLPEGACDDARIKEQDVRAVLTEHRDLQFKTGEVDWGLDSAVFEPWPEQIVPVLPSKAEEMFIARYKGLTGVGRFFG